MERLMQVPEDLRIIEGLSGMKQVVLVLRDVNNNEYLYRSENTLVMTLDKRVPKPQELYRDIAYSYMDHVLGWNVSAPVVPWELESGDRGVLRPFWRNAQTFEQYQIRSMVTALPDFWIRLAALDYLCAVIDRSANDILFVEGNPVVVDSGLSFVDGLNFTCQSDFLRKQLEGMALSQDILNDLAHLNLERTQKELKPVLSGGALSWLGARLSNLLQHGVVL